MTKQGKVLPARKQSDRSRDEESLLMRSAESLGRMIGTLQRQLDGATQSLSQNADDLMEVLPDIPFGGSGGRTRTATRRSGTAKTARRSAAGATTRTRAGGARKTGTQKAAGARKRQGASKAAKKR